ncbi:uncharacterized protein L201_006012 [Kwoniella dendrophila CBS 6074]|uniref:FAD dependent oxidoreductase domain-containing protein n=1 Tax=Kwoniella dendrophila CBS 6074 TaxID=1295534 RepID=A0AAX4K0J1_9TREE
MSSNTERPIIILGAGIIGLTTAIRLLESSLYQDKNIPVHIIADHLPNDPLDPKYASTIAGAHHLSFADDDDERQRRWDKRTFQIMYKEWKDEGESTGLMVMKQTEMFVGHTKHLKIYEEHPDFKVINHTERPDNIDHSVSFTSLTITPITYLNRLLKRISELSGGKLIIHRYHLPSLTYLSHPSIQAMIGPHIPLAVIVCVGIGALNLGDVEDKNVFSTRGQVVKIKAPWIRSGYTRQIGTLDGGENGERTYIIPRSNGEIILGGTRELNDWFPYPRQSTIKDILKRTIEICPDLIPNHLIAPALSNPQDQLPLEDLNKTKIGHTGITKSISPESLEPLIIEHLVGFRPSRKIGTRLERGKDLILDQNDQNEKTIVIHNYGHGGAGWQSCWGTAEDAISLMNEAVVGRSYI